MRRLALSLCVAGIVLGLADPVGASHSWGGYHFARSSNPFSVNLVDNMTTAWDGHLVNVSVDWTASDVLDAPIVAGNSSNSARKKCPAANGAVRVCNAGYGFNGWLGIAEIWISGGHIVKARARVNDSYFNTSTYNNSDAKRHVLCQEVGHTLGLGHQTAASCMDDHNGLFSDAYVSPNEHDYEQLVAIYDSHLDAAQASGGSGPGRGNGRAGGNVTVTRDGDHTLITWVFPADHGRPR
jgi:hypothetical protein